jgi:hypothetical protein
MQMPVQQQQQQQQQQQEGEEAKMKFRQQTTHRRGHRCLCIPGDMRDDNPLSSLDFLRAQVSVGVGALERLHQQPNRTHRSPRECGDLEISTPLSTTQIRNEAILAILMLPVPMHQHKCTSTITMGGTERGKKKEKEKEKEEGMIEPGKCNVCGKRETEKGPEGKRAT